MLLVPVPYGPGDGLPCGSRVQAWIGTWANFTFVRLARPSVVTFVSCMSTYEL